MKTVKVAYIGLLIALAFIFSYIEMLVPINIGVPGAKLGFANIVIVVALYTFGAKWAIVLSILRIILVGFTFGNMSALIYSLAGGVLSFIVMLIAKKSKLLSMTGVSVLGGVFHNVGQIIVAIFVLETSKLIYYLPILVIFGVVSGVFVGLLASLIAGRVKKIAKTSLDLS